MTKTLISLIAVTFISMSQGAQAGEFSDAMQGCKTSLMEFYGGEKEPRIKFREAKNRGAGEAHMFFQVRPQSTAGQGEKLVVKCIAKKSNGDVIALHVRDNQTKEWALATR